MAASVAGGRGGIFISEEVQEALSSGWPVVAFESALITHGLPFPRNLEVASRLEAAVRAEGVRPATIAVLDGRIQVGLRAPQIEALARADSRRKIAVRDLASAAMAGASGGTTVAATMFASYKAGIRLFATGGIGGVHREYPFDVSADLAALAQIPMIVVCAGAKAILDLRATLELLEAMSVPILGFMTEEFPAFYSRTSGYPVSARADSPSEIAEYWAMHCALGMNSALLVANPIPESMAIPVDEMESWITRASSQAREQGIHGQGLTPFLLERLGDISQGRSVDANTALLLSNARLAAKIAIAVAAMGRKGIAA